MKKAKLRYYPDDKAGFTRKQGTRGFVYRDSRGRKIDSRVILDRIRKLAIPPAWEDVWICPEANGHLQATGRDSRGRKQYRYHADWISNRGGEKYSRLSEFGRALPLIRRHVQKDLHQSGLSREKVLAAVIRLLDRTHLRIGNPEYLRDNRTYGLSTLKDRHVTFHTNGFGVRFRGKSGVWHERRVNDRRLARIVRQCRDLPGQELFQYRDGRGRHRPISSADVNQYIREASGGDFTAKDFRTWAGTVAAAAALVKLTQPASPTAANRTTAEVIRAVAADLGNTPAVCRKSYIHPAVIEAFHSCTWPSGKKSRGLTEEEACVVHLIRKRKAA